MPPKLLSRMLDHCNQMAGKTCEVGLTKQEALTYNQILVAIQKHFIIVELMQDIEIEKERGYRPKDKPEEETGETVPQ